MRTGADRTPSDPAAAAQVEAATRLAPPPATGWRNLLALLEPTGAFRTAAILVVILIGAYLRAWLIGQPAGSVDSDEAIVGLMARHFLDGELSPFYWGQAYGGTLEVGLIAIAFKFFGTSSWLLKAVPALLHGATAIVVWRIGRRAFDARAGIVAGLLFWVWPATYVWMSIQEYGFYEIGILLTALCVLLCLRLVEKPSWRDLVFLGLCSGAAWWSTALSALLLAPTMFWVLWRSRWLLLRLPILIVSAMAGALPWLVFNLQNDWASRVITSPLFVADAIRSHLVGYFERGLPMILGLRVPWSGYWLVPPAVGRILSALFLGGVVWMFCAGLARKSTPFTLFGGMLLVYPFLFALSPNAWFLEEGRYLSMMSIPIAVMMAYFVTRIRIETVVIASAILLTTSALIGLNRWEIGPDRPQPIPPSDLSPTISFLESRGVEAIFADYWIAYRISFETREEIIGASTAYVRYGPHQDLVRNSPNPAYIFYAGTPGDVDFPAKLAALGLSADRTQVDNLAVYMPSAKVLPEQVP